MFTIIYKYITGPKSAQSPQLYSKMGGRGEPRNSNNLPRWVVEFGKICRGKLWALLMISLVRACLTF